MNPTRDVLFVCTRNSARSQMAEAILRRLAGDRFTVHSAGLYPAEIHPLTVKVMTEAGYDLEGHSAKSVKEFLGREHFRYVISVCAQAAPECPRIFPNALNMLSWPFDDPAAADGSEEQRLEAFRRVREEIGQQIHSWLLDTVPNDSLSAT